MNNNKKLQRKIIRLAEMDESVLYYFKSECNHNCGFQKNYSEQNLLKILLFITNYR